MAEPTRRGFCAATMSLALPSSRASAQVRQWRKGSVRHILPAVSHEALLLKVSFEAPLRQAPVLAIGARKIRGVATAGGGRHWRFFADGLQPDHRYVLRLSAGSQVATDPWPLRTAPSPGANPQTLRILAFTCAGGDEDAIFRGRRSFNTLSARRALLARGLAYAPDAVIAIGDHIYWDQESGRRRGGGAPAALGERVGAFASSAADARNDAVLATIGDRQIAQLYGVTLRSTPTWFVRDDHDYFENDEFYGDRATFPPSPFNRALTDRLQAMYWPEFLKDAERPGDLPGDDCSFGTLRWGRLYEGLLYDCRGYLSHEAATAAFLPAAAEAWIAKRSTDSRVRHVMQVPSTPWGWTAGKWGEWYPDVLNRQGRMAADATKPGWRAGWLAQHQRLLEAAGSRGRASVVLSGDLHALGAGRIRRSGDLTPPSPVHTLLAGPLGTDDLSYPSSFRKTAPLVPQGIDLETHLAPMEENGFTLLDIEPQAIRVRQFAWRSPAPEAAIENLRPVHDLTVETA